MAINGMAIAAMAGGGILLYSGVQGKGVFSSLRYILMGESPKNAPILYQNSSGGTSIATSSGTTTGTNIPVTTYGGGSFRSNAISMLKAMGAPLTAANINSVVSWQAHEGANTYNNPLNTTLSNPNFGWTGNINSVGVKAFNTLADGIRANVWLIMNQYPSIYAALKSGVGLSTGDPGVSSELSTWSGGGYSSV